jgi:hypothetical protein
VAEDRVLRASFWADQNSTKMCTYEKLTLLYLMAHADRDGIVEINKQEINERVGLSNWNDPNSVANTVVGRVQSDLEGLAAWGEITLWEHANKQFAWIRRFSTDQPPNGKLKVARNPSLPAPPKEGVIECLTVYRGYPPPQGEGKRACPRAWGVVKTAGVADAGADIQRVYEEWRKRQKRPTQCKLTPATKETIRGGLRNGSPDELVNLIRYAYESNDPGPQWWQGKNPSGRTYLGMNNLFVGEKMADRLQMVEDWLEKHRSTQVAADGTDLGPLAAYRPTRGSGTGGVPTTTANNGSEAHAASEKVPRGTKSTPNPRPKRLNAQCRKMLLLFQQRGQNGVHTHELAGIALKYSARISELRGHGHKVICVERKPDGNNLYVIKEGASGEQMD